MEIRNHKKLSFDKFYVETRLQKLWVDGREVHLAIRPFQVLLFLIAERERVIGRAELLDKFWNGHDVYDDALRKCIGAIRKALEDTDRSPRFIETRRGSGYRFIGEVTEEEDTRGNGFEEKAVESSGWEMAESANGNTSSVGNRRRSENEQQSPHSVFRSRTIFFTFVVAVLVSLATLGFFAYRGQANNTQAKTLTETVAARRSIAILPLKNLTGDAANDYLSDGITETLINEVSQIESLKVISRGSAFQFKAKDVSAQEIGERLGVETILEGGFKQSGDQVRVEVRLIDTKDGSIMWASDFEQKKLA
ncbi:MAG: winged helix-turn-helix domain-containing protein, partial [Acidobacteriota bacterium]